MNSIIEAQIELKEQQYKLSYNFYRYLFETPRNRSEIVNIRISK